MTIRRNIKPKRKNTKQWSDTAWNGAVGITAVNKNLWWMFWNENLTLIILSVWLILNCLNCKCCKEMDVLWQWCVTFRVSCFLDFGHWLAFRTEHSVLKTSSSSFLMWKYLGGRGGLRDGTFSQLASSVEGCTSWFLHLKVETAGF
jgi:hypothetical protein